MRCTQAFFWNYGLLPPQYVSFAEGNPYPKKCFLSILDGRTLALPGLVLAVFEVPIVV